MALEHVQELERKASELLQMADTLKHLAKHCHSDKRPDCPIIDQLSGLADGKQPGTLCS